MRGSGEGDSPVVKEGRGRETAASIRRWLPFLIAAFVVAFDRLTKIYIQAHFSSLDAVSVIPRWFRIVHTENPGAAFGMFADGDPVLRSLVLVGVSVVVLVFVVSTLLKRSSSLGGTLTRLALGFILGGALGNLYDRVVLGTVTDFLEIYNGNWTFPAFNIADSAITVGAVLLLIDLLRPTHRRLPQQEAHPPTEF
jgi:signal peptidase II